MPIPLKEQGLALNKQEFRHSLRMRYNLPLNDLPRICAHGDCFTINHAPTRKKGGFVAQMHDREKDQERYSVVIVWLRARQSLEILRAVHMSVRCYPFIENNLEL